MKSKSQRKIDAQAMLDAHNKLTLEEKLAKAMARPGKSAKEVKRLQALIAERDAAKIAAKAEEDERRASKERINERLKKEGIEPEVPAKQKKAVKRAEGLTKGVVHIHTGTGKSKLIK